MSRFNHLELGRHHARFRRAADWTSAIRQIQNLRYRRGEAVGDGSQEGMKHPDELGDAAHGEA
jgi:hypothetical protein